MELGRVLADIKSALKAEGIESWRLDSELIVMEGAGCSRIQLITKDDIELSPLQLNKIAKMTARRLKREPMQYILGRCEFMGLEFELNSDTLIPRGDTECLVERVLEHIQTTGAKTVIDIGTGSGAIIISLAALGGVEGTAVDISSNALSKAQSNATLNGVADKISFIKSNLFENISEKFDIIVSNPPYIEREVIKTLDLQVKGFEPLRALDGGEDGLDFYRKIIESAHRYLNPNGFIAFEIGYNQGGEVSEMLMDAGFCSVKVGKDLAGLDRTVCGYLK